MALAAVRAWRAAPLLLLAVVLVALAPATARAHESSGREATGKAGLAVPSCPDDGPGHVCGCGNLVPMCGTQPLGLAPGFSIFSPAITSWREKPSRLAPALLPAHLLDYLRSRAPPLSV